MAGYYSMREIYNQHWLMNRSVNKVANAINDILMGKALYLTADKRLIDFRNYTESKTLNKKKMI